MANHLTPRTALLSVSDKTGLVELARVLIQHNITLLSTGGTAKLLRDHNLPVTDVSEHTGYPELMDGRVKTLHPIIHGGILARRNHDHATLQSQNITPIDLVIVNLYPFSQTIQQPNCTYEDAIEKIDIGGPTMIRSAAKNHHDVAVVVDPDDYACLIDALNQDQLDLDLRKSLAFKAFSHTAQYDSMIAHYFQQQHDETFSAFYTPTYQKANELRYGENPHQAAAVYSDPFNTEPCVANATQIQGKPLSFNNLNDANCAFECVKRFPLTQAACVIVKHANPCGVAICDQLTQAYQRAFITDKTSAFGGIIAFNQPLDHKTAAAIIDNQFCEVIIAPGIEEAAKAPLAEKPNIRVLTTTPLSDNMNQPSLTQHSICGGLLVQQADNQFDDPATFRVVSKCQPTEQHWNDLLFSWHVVNYVKSNAIVYVSDNATVGIGAGQMSRIVSAHIADYKARSEGLSVAGSVMGSDAFFPFRDSVDLAAKAGITAIIQPGGSIRDNEVIQAADEHNLVMILTGIRHFRH